MINVGRKMRRVGSDEKVDTEIDLLAPLEPV